MNTFTHIFTFNYFEIPLLDGHDDFLPMNHFKYNLDAEVFCPSKRRNNISTINNFPKNVNLIYSNLQGMLEGCHFDQFSNEINKVKNVHFGAVAETWLRNGVNTNKSIAIPGFKIVRSDRRSSTNDRNK